MILHGSATKVNLKNRSLTVGAEMRYERPDVLIQAIVVTASPHLTNIVVYFDRGDPVHLTTQLLREVLWLMPPEVIYEKDE